MKRTALETDLDGICEIKDALMVERDYLLRLRQISAAKAIDDYLREASNLSLLRLRDLLARAQVAAFGRTHQ